MNDSLTLLAAEVGNHLASKGQLLVVAESCTGGGLAEVITRIPGSSAWFDRGWVTYSNQAKSALLGVPARLIAAHGAVSSEVVTAMAGGAQAQVPGSWAIAVSGVAGPDGGSVEKPVGTVWIAWQGPNDAVASTECFRFPGDRLAVREQSVGAALTGLLTRARA